MVVDPHNASAYDSALSLSLFGPIRWKSGKGLRYGTGSMPQHVSLSPKYLLYLLTGCFNLEPAFSLTSKKQHMTHDSPQLNTAFFTLYSLMLVPRSSVRLRGSWLVVHVSLSHVTIIHFGSPNAKPDKSTTSWSWTWLPSTKVGYGMAQCVCCRGLTAFGGQMSSSNLCSSQRILNRRLWTESRTIPIWAVESTRNYSCARVKSL